MLDYRVIKILPFPAFFENLFENEFCGKLLRKLAKISIFVTYAFFPETFEETRIFSAIFDIELRLDV